MSTTKKQNTGNSPAVLVRSFKGEPAKLLAINAGNGLVEVANAELSASIRVRASSVYKFAEDVYRKLVAAFQRGDNNGLKRLWERATPFA